MVFGRNGVSPPKFLSPVRLCPAIEQKLDLLGICNVPRLFHNITKMLLIGELV